MVVMIPDEESFEDFNGSWGEYHLYEHLKEMKGNYYIFHSTEWNEKRRKSELSKREYIQWGESDFIVFSPEKGLLFVEVKDGLISYNRADGWKQTNSINGRTKSIDPMHQAEKSMFYFAELLKKAFYKQYEIACPYFTCSAAWFTSASRASVIGSLPNNYLEETTLWAEDMEDPVKVEKAINKALNAYGVYPVPRNEDYIKTVLDVISPEFGCFPSLRSRAFASKMIYRRMTREQAFLLDYLEEQEEAAIHGIAGTGKTVLAVKKAQQLAEDGKVLFLCFNKFLKEHLADEYPTNNVDFYNLDGLYTKLTRHKPSADDEERELELLDLLFSWDDYKLPYKHIVIDEGQDFSDVHLQELRKIASRHNGSFYVFHDKNQFVQGKKYPESLDKMDCRLVLSRNCRNTKEIAITSTRPIEYDSKKIKMRRDDPAAEMAAPPRPNIFLDRNETNIADTLVKLLKKYTQAGIDKFNIVVLTCKTEGNSLLDKINPQLAPGYLLTKEQDGKNILFTTVRKFKGLEADVIIAVDIDRAVFENERSRNAFYVGTSRARLFLELIATDTAANIAAGITGQELKGPRAIKAISDGLCVKIGTESDLV